MDDSQILRQAAHSAWKFGEIKPEHRWAVDKYAGATYPANKVAAALAAEYFAGGAGRSATLHSIASNGSAEEHSPVYSTATWACIGSVAEDSGDEFLASKYRGWLALRALTLCRPEAVALHFPDKTILQPQESGYHVAVCAMAGNRAVWPQTEFATPQLHWLRWLGSSLPANAVGFPGGRPRSHPAYDDYADMAWWTNIPGIDDIDLLVALANRYPARRNSSWIIYKWADGSVMSVMARSMAHTRGPVSVAHFVAWARELHLYCPSKSKGIGGDVWHQVLGTADGEFVRTWSDVHSFKIEIPSGYQHKIVWDAKGCRTVDGSSPVNPAPPPPRPPIDRIEDHLATIERDALWLKTYGMAHKNIGPEHHTHSQRIMNRVAAIRRLRS